MMVFENYYLCDFVRMGNISIPPTNTISALNHAAIILRKIPPNIKPINAHAATKTAYGICVATCSRCGQLAPVDDKIVVSEIGEAWSPNTAPPITAEQTIMANS